MYAGPSIHDHFRASVRWFPEAFIDHNLLDTLLLLALPGVTIAY